MENVQQELVNTLNDLVIINNDRLAGYEKAIENVKDSSEDLKTVFATLESHSKENISELSRWIVKLGGEVENGTRLDGKIYRVWMDIKATFTGKGRESVLESCIFGEQAAQKAYDAALAGDAEMRPEVRQMIVGQQSTLKSDLSKIKALEEVNS